MAIQTAARSSRKKTESSTGLKYRPFLRRRMRAGIFVPHDKEALDQAGLQHRADDWREQVEVVEW